MLDRAPSLPMFPPGRQGRRVDSMRWWVVDGIIFAAIGLLLLIATVAR
jgi:hypothetical protein